MPNYSIQVFEVGYNKVFPADFYFDGVHKGGELIERHPFCFTLIRGEGRNILIDTGVNLTTAERREFFAGAGAADPHSAPEVLATVGLTPDDIDDIIITHCHWDHLSGLVYFPKSRVYVQKEEYDRWREIRANPKHLPVFAMSFVPEDLDVLAAADGEGRVTFLDGERDNLFPGIHIRVARLGHSFAHQLVLVDTENGRFIIAGDVCNRPENLIGTAEYPHYIPNVKFSVGSVYNTLKEYDRLLEWANGDVSRIVMTHNSKREEGCKYTTSELGLRIYNVN